MVVRWWKHRSRRQRIGRENTLKSIYHVLEARNFQGEGVVLEELAQRRRETIEEARRQAEALATHGLATLSGEEKTIFLTPAGWQRACSIVRNHRLWEWYLANEAQVAADHVHEDAEKIEHVLGDEVVRKLERSLSYARKDPHGKLIPSLSDMHRMDIPERADARESVGYGRHDG